MRLPMIVNSEKGYDEANMRGFSHSWLLGAVCLLTWLSGCGSADRATDFEPLTPVKYEFRNWGATLRDIDTADDKKLWAVGEEGTILRSEDSGRTWRLEPLPPSCVERERWCTLWAIEAASDGESLWIAGDDVLLYSADGGKSWRTIDSEAFQTFGVRGWRDIHLAPEGKVWVAGEIGIFYSEDNGKTWTDQTKNLEIGAVTTLFSSGDLETLFATGSNGLVLRYDPRNKAWARVSLEIPIDLENSNAALLAKDRANTLWLSAGAGYVFRSSDEGKTWQPQRQWPTDLAVQAFDGRSFFALDYSKDKIIEYDTSGRRKGDVSLPGVVAVRTAGAAASIWALGSTGEMWKRTDKTEKAWEPIRITLGRYAEALYADPKGLEAWASTGSGLVYSADGGRNWRKIWSEDSNEVGPRTNVMFARQGTIWEFNDYGKIRRLMEGKYWEEDPVKMLERDAVVAVSDGPNGPLFWRAAEGHIQKSSWGVGWKNVIPLPDVDGYPRNLLVVNQGEFWLSIGEYELWHYSKSWQKRGKGYGLYGTRDNGRELWAVAGYSLDLGRTWNKVQGNIALTTSGVIAGSFLGTRVGLLPTISEPPYLEYGVGDPTLRVQIKGCCVESVALEAADVSRIESESYEQMPEGMRTAHAEGEVWRLPLTPGEINLHSGDKVHFKVTVTTKEKDGTEGFTQQSNFSLVYDRWGWWRGLSTSLKAAIIGCSFVLVLYSLLGLLLLCSPSTLLTVDRMVPLTALAESAAASLPYFGGALKAVGNAFLLPSMLRSERVLAAWVSQRRTKLETALRSEDIVVNSPVYVPLPVSLKSQLGVVVVARPSAPELLPFIERAAGPLVLEVIGIGGAGKTTLAVQVARWALNGQLGSTMIPVPVNEDTTDLVGAVRRKLQAWLGERLTDDLFNALMRNTLVQNRFLT